MRRAHDLLNQMAYIDFLSVVHKSTKRSATMQLADKAVRTGVKHFVYASEPVMNFVCEAYHVI